MFAGIKRLLGLENILDNNDIDIAGNTKRPEWEREDETIDENKKQKVLEELKLERKNKSFKKSNKLRNRM